MCLSARSSGDVVITNSGNFNFSKSYYTRVGKVVTMVINGTWLAAVGGSMTIALPNSFTINTPVNGRVIGKTMGSVAGGLSGIPVAVSELTNNNSIQLKVETNTANIVFSVSFTFLSN